MKRNIFGLILAVAGSSAVHAQQTQQFYGTQQGYGAYGQVGYGQSQTQGGYGQGQQSLPPQVSGNGGGINPIFTVPTSTPGGPVYAAQSSMGERPAFNGSNVNCVVDRNGNTRLVPAGAQGGLPNGGNHR